MINIKLILNNIFLFKDKIKIRSSDLNLKKILNLYSKYKFFKKKNDLLRLKRNLYSQKIFIYKKKNKKIYKICKYVIKIKKKIKNLNKKINILYLKLCNKLYYIPNSFSDDVPIGNNDVYNKVIYSNGNIKKKNFNVIDHIEFGEKTGLINFSESSMLSGSGFAVMKGEIAALYRAIEQYMIYIHTKNNNYYEIYVPYIIKKKLLYNTGQLPKFSEDIFFIDSQSNNVNEDLSLIPTAEVSLVNLYINKSLNLENLPIKLVSSTPCFRSEPISYGHNNRGLIRLHQFNKVELIQIVHPDYSMEALENLTSDAEYILKKLNLPYRKVLLCTGSMSFSSFKTYDLEVWSPIDNSYIEVSSCSNTTNFQSYKINVYIKNNKKKIFPHIINGSGLAVGRILVLILENHQVSYGIVKIPKVLVKYMNGKKYIKC